jgi:hypothetical protein
VLTREHPEREQAWLHFAAFQLEASQLLSRKGLEASTAERQAAILRRGLQHHPGSVRLLLALLRAQAGLLEPQELRRSWQEALEEHPGCAAADKLPAACLPALCVPGQQPRAAAAASAPGPAPAGAAARARAPPPTPHPSPLAPRPSPRRRCAELWRGYLQQLLAGFSTFSCAAVADACQDALADLLAERSRAARLQQPERAQQLEHEAVGFFLACCRLQLEAGFTEQALAAVQAALEFNCFAPAIPNASQPVLVRLFAAFWRSSAPRLGEPGAGGWADALANPGRAAAAAAAAAQQAGAAGGGGGQEQEQEKQEEPQGDLGWSGWVSLPEEEEEQQQEQRQQEEAQEAGPRIVFGIKPAAGAGAADEEEEEDLRATRRGPAKAALAPVPLLAAEAPAEAPPEAAGPAAGRAADSADQDAEDLLRSILVGGAESEERESGEEEGEEGEEGEGGQPGAPEEGEARA